MIYTPIKSDATRVSALLSGEVDLVTDLPTQDVERLRKDAEAQGARRPRGAHHLHRHGPAQRRAQVLAASRARTRSRTCACARRSTWRSTARRSSASTMRGLSIPAGLMIAPGVHGYSKDIDVLSKYDPAGGEEAARRGGLPERLRVHARLPERPLRQRREDLPGAGRHVGAGRAASAKLNAMPFANFIPKILNFDSSAYMLGWGVADLRRALHAAVAGAHQDHGRRRQLQPRPRQRHEARPHDRRDQDRDRSDEARRAAARGPGDARATRHYYVPLHHQMRPWAMKKNVSIAYSPDDRPQARFATVK